MKQAKTRQKDSIQPSFQIRNQEGNNDCRLAVMIQLRPYGCLFQGFAFIYFASTWIVIIFVEVFLSLLFISDMEVSDIRSLIGMMIFSSKTGDYLSLFFFLKWRLVNVTVNM